MSQAPFELAVERYIDAPPETVFKVWTERLEEWWAPKPWTTQLIEQDLRPGGRSAMIMAGPDGATPPMEGVFLEVIPNRSIVFTDAYKAGWIPQEAFMTAFFQFARRDRARATAPAPGTGTRPRRPSMRRWGSSPDGGSSPGNSPNWRRPRREGLRRPPPSAGCRRC